MARERYADQVRLLVDILPAIAAEEDFALKGGAAINLSTETFRVFPSTLI